MSEKRFVRGVAPLVRKMLVKMGLDVEDENIKDTHTRYAHVLYDLTKGLRTRDEEIQKILSAVYHEPHKEMIVVSGIKGSSFCPHHLLCVLYSCDVGYIPNGKVLGLSKIPRLVEVCASKPLLQEALTDEIADLMMEHVKPLGCGVTIHARHLCMEVRGIRKNAMTITSALRGVFLKEQGVKEEFSRLCHRPESL